jgi:hypothetical protein
MKTVKVVKARVLSRRGAAEYLAVSVDTLSAG